MTIIERLEEKVTRQESKVARESEKLAAYKEQLETAMFATFKRRQSISHMSFEEALDHAFGRERQFDDSEFRKDTISVAGPATQGRLWGGNWRVPSIPVSLSRVPMLSNSSATATARTYRSPAPASRALSRQVRTTSAKFFICPGR